MNYLPYLHQLALMSLSYNSEWPHLGSEVISDGRRFSDHECRVDHSDGQWPAAAEDQRNVEEGPNLAQPPPISVMAWETMATGTDHVTLTAVPGIIVEHSTR